MGQRSCRAQRPVVPPPRRPRRHAGAAARPPGRDATSDAWSSANASSWSRRSPHSSWSATTAVCSRSARARSSTSAARSSPPSSSASAPHCHIGPYTMMLDNDFHRVEPERRLERPPSKPIIVEDNVWIGARVILMCGRHRRRGQLRRRRQRRDVRRPAAHARRRRAGAGASGSCDVDAPVVSVVIPTYNRRRPARAAPSPASPPRRGLRRDARGHRRVRRLDRRHRRVPRVGGALPLAGRRPDARRNAGPAAARNRGVRRGARRARRCSSTTTSSRRRISSLPTCATTTRPSDDLVVIGPMSTPRRLPISPWVQWEQDMLYKQYDAMDRGDYEATARQFYTGNASVARRHLEAVGGFDAAFRRAEDVELAYRLADRGLQFAFAPDAVVLHYAERSFDAWLQARLRLRPQRRDLRPRPRPARGCSTRSAAEFHERHRLVRRLTRCVPAAPAAAPSRRSCCCRSPRGRRPPRRRSRHAPGAERGLQPRVLPGHGRRARVSRRPARSLRRRPVRRDADRPRVGFVLEQTLGHITHTRQPAAPRRRRPDRSTPCSRRSTFEVDGLAGARARASATGRCAPGSGPGGRSAGCGAPVRSTPCSSTPRCRRSSSPDQLRRIPTVVSLDATPIQYDELGAHYGHDTGSDARRAAEVAGEPRLLRPGGGDRRRGREWTKAGLVDRYDVPADKITVIPPGVDYERWAAIGGDGRAGDATAGPRPVRRRRLRAQGRPRPARGACAGCAPPASTSSSTSSPATTVPASRRRPRPPRARRRTARS